MVKARQNEQREQRIVKAMACGTPVVGFKTGGIPEMIEDGRTGLMAPTGNVKELARAIAFLLDHERERSVMAKQARKRVQEKFSRDGQVEKYLALYSRLLAARGGNTRQ
jgi:glycosyltransferase involved in cell wall biosynthesis